MRKIINSTYLTLDGAIEDPHLWPSLGSVAEEASYAIQNDLLHACDALVMGRRTYNSFAAVWPARSGDSFSDRINAMRKFVVSTTMGSPTWQNTTVIRDNLIDVMRTMKQQPGRDILQYGLGRVSFAMLEHRLIDEVRLWIHPLILGRRGPSLPHFIGCPPVRLHLCDMRVLANGISVMSYRVDYVSVEVPRRFNQQAAEPASLGGVR